MSQWIDLGPLHDFPPGTQTQVKAADRSVVLLNVDGRFFAFLNVCPHAGLPLVQGTRHRLVFTCPFHQYMFNLETGRNVDYPYDEPPLRLFSTRIQNDILQIQIDKEPDHGQPRP